MIEYEKIETLYDRDPEDMKRIILGQLRLPEFAIPQKWHLTEKVDGTNLRLIYSPPAGVTFRGRTDNANLNDRESEWLTERFTHELFAEVFPDAYNEPVTIYGEFYGPKIQSGGWYRDDYGFRVFDVRIGDWWLNWDNVEDVARKLGLKTVPVMVSGVNLAEALSFVKKASYVQGFESSIPDGRLHEGIVARTDPLLFMRDGRRLMWKLKVRDLV